MALDLAKNQNLDDASCSFVDTADQTKKLQFQASGITTGTTRTFTAPDSSGNLVTSGTEAVVWQATVGGSASPTNYTTLEAAIAAGHERVLVKSTINLGADIPLTAAGNYLIGVIPGVSVAMSVFQFTYTGTSTIKFVGAAGSTVIGVSGAITATIPTSGFIFNNTGFPLSITEIENLSIAFLGASADNLNIAAVGVERYINISLTLPNKTGTGIKTTSPQSCINGLRIFGGGGTVCANGLQITAGGRYDNLYFAGSWAASATNPLMTVTSAETVMENVFIDVSIALVTTAKLSLGGSVSNVVAKAGLALDLKANVAGTQISNYSLNGGTLDTATFAFATTGGASSNNYVFAYDTNIQTVAVADTFQDITFDTNVQLNGWTHTASSANFTCTQTGLYLVNYMGEGNVSAGAPKYIEIQGMNNGVQVAGSRALFNIGDNDASKTVSGSFLVSMTATQILKLRLTGGSTNVRLMVPTLGQSTVQPSIAMNIIRIA